MKQNLSQDIKRLNGIVKSLSNMKKAFEQNKITSPENLMDDEITQAACSQFITNIEEAKKRLRDETLNRLVALNKIKLDRARNIASHDYCSLDFTVVYYICKRLIKPAVLSEVYSVLAEIKQSEDKDDI